MTKYLYLFLKMDCKNRATHVNLKFEINCNGCCLLNKTKLKNPHKTKFSVSINGKNIF